MQPEPTPSRVPQHVTSAEVSLEPIFVSVKQAAQMLGLSPWVCTKLLNEKQVESRYYGTRRLVVVKSLQRYAATLPSQPTITASDAAS